MQVYSQLDLSGGMQSATSHLLRKRNEVELSENADYNSNIGAASRRDGYEKVANTIESGKDSLYGGVYNYFDNYKVIVGVNNSGDTAANLKYLDGDQYWKDIITDAAPNTRFQCVTHLDELYVAGCSNNNTYLTLRNVDSTLTASTTRNLFAAPKAKYIAEYNGRLFAINAEINGSKYPDRAYYSSPPLGAATFIQTNQKGLLKQLRVNSVRYLKVGMQIDIYGAGTEAKKVSALTIISVDKKNNRISFEATSVDVADNDEIWLTGRKGKLTQYWNTDYPTPQNADFVRVPPGKDTDPEFTGWTKNNNRLLLFTKNSFLKYDGNNLVNVSETVGCESHESIQNIGSWTLWFHKTGIWGYNDNTGQLKLLSRGIQDIIRRIKQTSYPYISAVVVGRVYKVSVGELLDVDVATTSTSTSSTSTSSTSTSTSSTSTSSTSTSSTSTSQTTTSTSTSSTSISTSSTSVSTSSTSTSLSTSTSSTSTSTIASEKKVVRICYDFDMNAWWLEVHKREHRFQFNHTMHGYTKPYFTDETGRLFRDETGNLDNADTIPMKIRFGRNNLGVEQAKTFHSVIVNSENARGAKVQYSVDGGAFKTLGEITDNAQSFVFPQRGQQVEGRDIDYQIVHNDIGTKPVINGLSTYYNVTETIVNELGSRV